MVADEIYNTYIISYHLQLFVPNARSIYGSAHKIVRLNTDYGDLFSTSIFITKRHIKAIDQNTQRCDQENARVNPSSCVAKFIEKELGCTASVIGSQYFNGTRCTTKAQLLALANVSRILAQANGNDLYDMVGCLSPCEKHKYSLSLDPIKVEYANAWIGEPVGELHLRFIHLDGTYEEQEQYVIYDMNSFIADVGGYMGLLLGCSLLSLYNEMETLLRKIFSKSPKRKEEGGIIKRI